MKDTLALGVVAALIIVITFANLYLGFVR